MTGKFKPDINCVKISASLDLVRRAPDKFRAPVMYPVMERRIPAETQLSASLPEFRFWLLLPESGSG